MDFQTAQDVKHRIAFLANQSQHCTNGVVIHQSFQFTVTKGKKKFIAFKDLANSLILKYSETHPVSVPHLVTKIRSILDIYRSLIKRISANSVLIGNFIQEKFELPLLDATPTTSAKPASGELKSPPQHHSPEKPAHKTLQVTTPVKTRQECGNCSVAKKVNSSLQKSLKLEKSKQHKLKRFASNVKKSLNLKAQKQKISRHEQRLADQKITIRKLQIKLNHVERQLLKSHRSNDNHTKDVSKLVLENESLRKTVHDLQRTITQQKTEIAKLHQYSEDLELTLKDNQLEKKELKTKKGKAYSSDLRCLVYNQLVCDVPVKNCGFLINAFSRVLCKADLASTPSPATCAQMAYELGVITTIQLMERMLMQNGPICLSWDATTLDGAHINEIHLTVNRSECLTLDVRHIPGGKASDYVSHIISSLTEAADVYGRYVGKSQEDIFFQVKSKITCTLSDRAAVNACVTRQLRDELDSHLLQLNCNVHPLDSVARRAKQNLTKLDASRQIRGSCFGTEGSATNLINAVSVLRFKDGSGDPAGFKDMLRRHNLPVGTFVRYVGNRMHVLFHLAGILVLHCSKVKEFLETRCIAGGLLRSRLLKDLMDDKIIVQVWALAVIGKVFTGPWMNKFYSSEMSNLDMRPLVQKSERQLRLWQSAPELLMSPTLNAFGEPLCPESDDVLSALLCFVSGEDDIQREALKALVQACLDVLHSQLGLFLTDPEPSADITQKAVCAPTHNMASERALGCLDKMFRRAPIATGGFLNGKVRSKLNKCTQWLESQEPSVQDSIISFAISEAKLERVRRCVSDREVIEEIDRRRGVVATERNEKEKKLALKSISKCMKEKSTEGLECSEIVKEKVQRFINDPNSLLGLAFLHSRDSKDFNGRFQGFEGSEHVTIGYWSIEEPESYSVDKTVSVISFFAEAIIGAISFI